LATGLDLSGMMSPMETLHNKTNQPLYEQAIFGFDSAWCGDKTGGICALLHDGKSWVFVEPQMVSFEEAAQFIVKHPARYQLIAIDQPLIVKVKNEEDFTINYEGKKTPCRPVEKVVDKLMYKLKSSVIPSNLSQECVSGLQKFGEGSPLQNFLNQIQNHDKDKDPVNAQSASKGRYVIEVYPKLALTGWITEFYSDRRAPKYDPKGKFDLDDWQLICNKLSEKCELNLSQNLNQVACYLNYLKCLSEKAKPTKADQDKLDSVICLLVGWQWRHSASLLDTSASSKMAMIGDFETGYMITPVTKETAKVLKESPHAPESPITFYK
jgi:predicted RNase H-like nuclease